MQDETTIKKAVRDRYAGHATAGTSCCGPATSGSSCGCGSATASAETLKREQLGYTADDLSDVPEGADLGLLSGDAFSQALGINSQGQIVGVSCGDLCHAVLWQDGHMYLLQDLVGAGFPDYLWSARDINDSGQVTGRMYLASGQPVTYVATPVLPLP